MVLPYFPLKRLFDVRTPFPDPPNCNCVRWLYRMCGWPKVNLTDENHDQTVTAVEFAHMKLCWANVWFVRWFELGQAGFSRKSWGRERGTKTVEGATLLHNSTRMIATIAIWSLSHQTMGLLFVGRQEHYIFVPCIDTKNKVWKTTPISQRDKLHLETQHVSIGI